MDRTVRMRGCLSMLLLSRSDRKFKLKYGHRHDSCTRTCSWQCTFCDCHASFVAVSVVTITERGNKPTQGCYYLGAPSSCARQVHAVVSRRFFCANERNLAQLLRRNQRARKFNKKQHNDAVSCDIHMLMGWSERWPCGWL